MHALATKTNVAGSGPKRAPVVRTPEKRPSLAANRLRQKKLGDGDDLFSRTRSSRNASRVPTQSMTFTEPNSIGFAASIRRVDRRWDDFSEETSSRKRPARRSMFSSRQHDGEEATEPEAGSLLTAAAEPVSAASLVELEEGETIQLPDITLPAEVAAEEQSDPIISHIDYNPSITRAGAVPPPFGATRPYTHALSGIIVSLRRGVYNVQATLDNPITFQVGGGARTDIDSAGDADITAASYPTVASDLTPDMSSDNGRPPRTQFWAEDLTIKHERFHAREDVSFGRQGVRIARRWLNTQDASSVAQVNTLLGEVPTRVADHVRVNMAAPAREERAYGDGAPSYTARANAIQRRGDRGGY